MDELNHSALSVQSGSLGEKKPKTWERCIN